MDHELSILLNDFLLKYLNSLYAEFNGDIKGEPAYIAFAVLFLWSPTAAWISGQVLTVSGGGSQELIDRQSTFSALLPFSISRRNEFRWIPSSRWF